MQRAPENRFVRPLLVLAAILTTTAAVWVAGLGGPRPTETIAAGGTPLSLDDVFTADGVLDDCLNRPLANFDLSGPATRTLARFIYFDQSMRGSVFWGYCNPDLADPCDCDCTEGVDPCTQSGNPAIMKQSRQTVELWIPANPNFSGTPTLLVDKGTNRGSVTYEEKVLLAKNS